MAGGTLSAESGVTVSALDEKGVSAEMSFAPVTDSQAVVAADGKALVYMDSASHSYAVTGGDAEANAGYIVINDASAPRDYQFAFDVNGAPALLSVEADGSVLVMDQQGTKVNAIHPAWAKDARGRSLSTSYSVVGNILTQRVDGITNSTAFPVVADPRAACNLVWCTIEFKRTETKTASQTAAGAAGVLCGALTLGGLPVVGIVCGAYGTALWIAANQAVNQGDCVGFRFLTVGGSAHPVIIRCYA
jgi:hypothetical protein